VLVIFFLQVCERKTSREEVLHPEYPFFCLTNRFKALNGTQSMTAAKEISHCVNVRVQLPLPGGKETTLNYESP